MLNELPEEHGNRTIKIDKHKVTIIEGTARGSILLGNIKALLLDVAREMSGEEQNANLLAVLRNIETFIQAQGLPHVRSSKFTLKGEDKCC